MSELEGNDPHEPFPLVLGAKVRPAPIIDLTENTRAWHSEEMCQVLNGPCFPRVLIRGDWS